MRLLFYEPVHTGHHFAYLARMLPGFVELPIEIVVATTPQARDSQEFATQLAPFGDRIEVLANLTPAGRNPVTGPRHRLRELKVTIRDVRPDHVMVCYADGLWEQAYLQSLFGRRPWPRELVVEGWIYRGRFADPSDGRLKSRLRRQLFAGLLHSGLFRKLHLDHELLYSMAQPIAESTDTQVVLTPNPIVLFESMSKDVARGNLGLEADGKWISLSGMIATYKGALLLLDAYRIHRERCRAGAARLLLAGPHEPAVKAKLGCEPFRSQVAAGSIVSIDRYISEREMFEAAAAADLVLAPYPNHQGRSSIILWAAAAGRPSLGADDGCIGHVIRHEQLGFTCSVKDTEALASAITAGLAALWSESDATRVRSYAEFHRVENYRQIASQLVRDRIAAAAAS